MASPVRRIVLAYSGGLDTSVILRWLVDRYQAEVIAFCADLGQAEELDGLDAKARATGAVKCIVEDLREEFVRDFVFPMFRAGAIYEPAQDDGGVEAARVGEHDATDGGCHGDLAS